MCGIAGLFSENGLDSDAPMALGRMTDKLAHRGPDASGLWHDAPHGIALGHRRLSVVGLGSAGDQPMHSASGRYVLCLNGEVYNHKSLRAHLERSAKAPHWRGTSDTEVLLAAIESWGLHEALGQVRGMYALALWDRERRALSLARDPMGEKPLHVGRIGRSVAFASELKSFVAHPDWRGEIDPTAVALSLRHGQIPAPRTLWRGVEKVMPGTVLEIRGVAPEAWLRSVHWNMLAEARVARQTPFPGSAATAVDRLDMLLRQAVGHQLTADVPVGAFLSGGIDSSVTVAVMQAVADRPVETFSLGFAEAGRDEAGFARAVAGHLATRHNELYLSGAEALDLLAEMPEAYDEPFADSSQLATYAVARFARARVTVALSGDAGDELFGGYNRYHKARRLWKAGATGRLRRQATRAALSALDGGLLSGAMRAGVEHAFGQSVEAARLQLARPRAMMDTGEPTAAYEAMFTALENPVPLVRGAEAIEEPLTATIAAEPGWSVLDRTSFLDMMRYLPDDILVKLDRAAMASGLETRIPMLDPEVVRFALSLPDAIKLMGGKPKGILRRVLARYVPPALWDRPKMGFGVPTGEWLRGPLMALADDMFSEATLIRTGLLEPGPVMALWSQFRRGGRVRTKLIWTLFVTQLYLERLTRGQRLAA